MNLLIDARRPLLVGILDYDAIGESAESSIDSAVSSYRKAAAGPLGWLVGRFLCPSSRLEDLVGVLTKSMVAGERPWQIGVVVDEALGTAAMHAGVFHNYMDPAGAVTSIELVANSGLDITAKSLATAAAGLSRSIVAYANLGASEPSVEVADLAELNQSLVQPVGGLVRLPDHEADKLAPALVMCARGGVPLRVASPLARDSMLLEVLTAAALASRPGSTDRVVEVFDSGPINATAVGLRWKDDLFGVPDIKRARATIHSWTCRDLGAAFDSFDELGLV